MENYNGIKLNGDSAEGCNILLDLNCGAEEKDPIAELEQIIRKDRHDLVVPIYLIEELN